MPRTIEIDDKKHSVATETELLAFANSIREAGGADPLGALLPSRPANPEQCLIANALNFGCTVESYGGRFADGSSKWRMVLPHNLSKDQRKSLAAVPGVRLRLERDKDDDHFGSYYLTLPKHIGNAAYAFDLEAAFQSYAVNS